MRTAPDDEYTFKRDHDGTETVEHRGVIIATLQSRSTRAPGLDLTPNLVIDEVRLIRAIKAAHVAEFWKRGTPQAGCMVSVRVHVPA